MSRSGDLLENDSRCEGRSRTRPLASLPLARQGRAKAPDNESNEGESWNGFNPAVIRSSLDPIVGQ